MRRFLYIFKVLAIAALMHLPWALRFVVRSAFEKAIDTVVNYTNRG